MQKRCKLTSLASAKCKQGNLNQSVLRHMPFLGYECHATSCRLLEIVRQEYVNSTFGIYIHEIKQF